jgi:hypothetical protein
MKDFISRNVETKKSLCLDQLWKTSNIVIKHCRIKLEQELTFHPKNISKNQAKTSFRLQQPQTEFYDKMHAYQEAKNRHIADQLQEKEMEIERLRKELKQEKMFRRKSVEQYQQKQDSKRSSIFHRRTNCSKSPSFRKFEENLTFKPEINTMSRRMSRKSDVCSMLYQDAKDRESRQRERINTEISNTKKRQNSHQRSTERINNRLIVTKISKIINEACKAIGVISNRPISYHEMVKLMYTMGYILDNITEYEKLLIDNMFQSISNEDNSLYIKNIFAFLLAIHSITTSEKFIFTSSASQLESQYVSVYDIQEDPRINIKYDKSSLSSKMQRYGYLSPSSNFHFSSLDEIKEVSRLYKVFLDNYKISAPCAYYGCNSPSYERQKAEENVFKPKINRSRSRKDTKQEDYKSREEVLLKKGEVYRERLMERKKGRAEEEVKGWTFVPETNVYKSGKVKSKVFGEEKGRDLDRIYWVRLLKRII